ncbi:hypothetical protein [Sedimentibacter sp.]|uniref:rolling circle replication-associated protein n=1 Tax=Sedimentibacter sp. TaxID=1960295 RepID=UPI0028ACA57E|nr:hypothetical protein [Sedimentibacter sp.]
MRLYGDCNVYYYPNKAQNPYKIIFHKQRFISPEEQLKFVEKEEVEEKESLFELTEGEKRLNHIARVKTKVRDYAFCNEWEYFVTFTFSDQNIDRYDLKEVKKRMGKFFNNYKNRKNPDFCYLLVPEFHQDGAIHFHGLVKGIRDFDLYEFTPFRSNGDYIVTCKSNGQAVMTYSKLPVYILNQLDKGLKVYDFSEFSQRFGFTTVEPIRNMDAAALYITKYITKDLVSLPLHTCCYLNSKGLRTPEIVHQDFGGIVPKCDYENDFVAIKWFDSLEGYSDVLMNV